MPPSNRVPSTHNRDPEVRGLQFAPTGDLSQERQPASGYLPGEGLSSFLTSTLQVACTLKPSHLLMNSSQGSRATPEKTSVTQGMGQGRGTQQIREHLDCSDCRPISNPPIWCKGICSVSRDFLTEWRQDNARLQKGEAQAWTTHALTCVTEKAETTAWITQLALLTCPSRAEDTNSRTAHPMPLACSLHSLLASHIPLSSSTSSRPVLK